jgi:hypothetical protein
VIGHAAPDTFAFMTHDHHGHSHPHAGHHDHPEHSHGHVSAASAVALRTAFFINLAFTLVEIVGGM